MELEQKNESLKELLLIEDEKQFRIQLLKLLERIADELEKH